MHYFQTSDVAGVLFTRAALPGTFPLAAGLVDSPSAPDVVVSLRWNDHKNPYGVAGAIVGDIGLPVGHGMHGTLSRYDLHNTLIANGPDFVAGLQDQFPSGNIDVAPTVAWILGVPPQPSFDGRILWEAIRYAQPPQPLPQPETKRLEAQASVEGVTWKQYLQTVQMGSTTYLDEGNFEPSAP